VKTVPRASLLIGIFFGGCVVNSYQANTQSTAVVKDTDKELGFMDHRCTMLITIDGRPLSIREHAHLPTSGLAVDSGHHRFFINFVDRRVPSASGTFDFNLLGGYTYRIELVPSNSDPSSLRWEVHLLLEGATGDVVVDSIPVVIQPSQGSSQFTQIQIFNYRRAK
jgi:hypothetical protein